MRFYNLDLKINTRNKVLDSSTSKFNRSKNCQYIGLGGSGQPIRVCRGMVRWQKVKLANEHDGTISCTQCLVGISRSYSFRLHVLQIISSFQEGKYLQLNIYIRPGEW